MLARTERQQRLRVLVVDDDADTVDSTATLLELGGHEVKTALRGADAIARAAYFRPEVIMLDVAMPEMDGYETARQIQDLVLPPPVLVAVSGYGDLSARRRAAEAGFDLHLLKPVEGGFFEQIHLLVQDTYRLRKAIVRITERNQQTMLGLAAAYIQAGHTMLYVARTTGNETTRARCLSKVKATCQRLTSWIERYPDLGSGLRDDLEDLIRHLLRGA